MKRQDNPMWTFLTHQVSCAKKILIFVVMLASLFTTPVGYVTENINPGVSEDMCADQWRTNLENKIDRKAYRHFDILNVDGYSTMLPRPESAGAAGVPPVPKMPAREFKAASTEGEIAKPIAKDEVDEDDIDFCFKSRSVDDSTDAKRRGDFITEIANPVEDGSESLARDISSTGSISNAVYQSCTQQSNGSRPNLRVDVHDVWKTSETRCSCSEAELA